jgi:FkbM family methyltransferase
MSQPSFRDRIKNVLPFPVAAGLRDGWGQVRRSILWRLRDPEHTLLSELKVRVASPSDWFVYNEVFVNGEYDLVISRLIEQTQSTAASPLVLDLGANAGFFTLRLLDRWWTAHGSTRAQPHVVCVEGSPRTFRVLTKNLAQPQLEECCSAHLGLAGRRSGAALISTSPNSGVNSIVNRASLFRRESQFLDLTRLLPPGERIALMKCDIEGAEELLLESYPDLLLRVDLAVIELHHLFCDVERCRALLAAAGLTRRTLLRPRDADQCSVECFSR